MLYVEKTIPDDCFRLAPNLQQLDKYELAAMGIDPLTALINPFRYNRPNTHTFTIFVKWQKYCFAKQPMLVNDIEMYYFYKHLPKVDVDIQPIISELGPKWTTELKDKGQL